MYFLAKLFSVPVAYAGVEQLVYKINRVILNPLIILMFAVALVSFLFGVAEFIGNAGSEEKRTKGKQHMIWGVIGMFIMVGVFAIMQIIVNTIGSDAKIQGVGFD